MLVAQYLVNGLINGFLFALIAVGFSLFFGVTKTFHFAHGATLTTIAFVYITFAKMQVPWGLPALLAAIAGLALGLACERLVYQPMRRSGAPDLTIFVASFGLLIVTNNVWQLIYGGAVQSLSSAVSSGTPVAGIVVSPLNGITVLCAVVLFALVAAFMRNTKWGVGIAAIIDNRDLAEMIGIDFERHALVTMAIASLMIVPAAIVITYQEGVTPTIGDGYVLVAAAATLVGGVGNLYGAALGAFVLSIIDSLSVVVLPGTWQTGVTFAILFLVIMLRPQGILGTVRR